MQKMEGSDIQLWSTASAKKSEMGSVFVVSLGLADLDPTVHCSQVLRVDIAD
jgi:hypothetical protein